MDFYDTILNIIDNNNDIKNKQKYISKMKPLKMINHKKLILTQYKNIYELYKKQ